MNTTIKSPLSRFAWRANFGRQAAVLLLTIFMQARVQAAIVWFFDDDTKQWNYEAYDEDHSCTPPPDGCCLAPGGGGPPGPPGSPGAPGPQGGPPSPPPGGTGAKGNSSGCGGCGGSQFGAPSAAGMPVWRVSEPMLNLWLHDTPMWYRPSRGPEVAVTLQFKNNSGGLNRLDFKQRDIYGFGSGWHSPWRSYLQVSGSTAILFRGDGDGAVVPVGGVKDYHTQATLELVGTNYVLTHSWGAKHTYSFNILDYNSRPTYFLSKIEDVQGNATRLEHVFTNGAVRLMKIIDAESLETTFSYTNANGFSNLISKIVGPHSGLKCSFQYDEWARLTNILDTIGMNSQMIYADSSTNGPAYDNAITSLITPYGTNTFKMYGAGVPTNPRSVVVSEMGLRTHYFGYEESLLGGMVPTNYVADEPAIAAAIGETFDSTNSQARNSFYWSPRQINQMSENARTNLLAANPPETLTSGDYALARQRHWLKRSKGSLYASTELKEFVGGTLSYERGPSPDGSQAGLLIWYDYEGKPAPDLEGTNYLPRLTAWKLPNGESRYTYAARNTFGHPTNLTETYTSPSGLALRTNLLEYAANGIDMTRRLQVLGAASSQVSSNVYNASHQVVTNFNALNETTAYSYDSSNRLTGVIHPTGLVTTNLYGTNGFLATSIDRDAVQSYRTNSYTYSNTLVWTHTDPRGLKLQYEYDALRRMTAVFHPDGTSISYTFDKLDLIQVVDRMGFTNRMDYNSLRQRIRAVDALGRTNTFNYCVCGSLDSMTDPLGNTTSFTYDNLGRLLGTVSADTFSATNQYDLAGRLTVRSDNAGLVVTNFYNNQGLTIAVSNAFGQLSAVNYDIEDHALQSTDNNGITVTNAYDDLGRLVVRGYADGGIERFVYSAFGLMAHTNQLTNAVRYGYDPLRRKVAETNANNEVTQFAYGGSGDLLTLTDGKSQATTWKYDEYGRMTNKLDAAGTVIFRYAYDFNGRLSWRWTPEKGYTYYSYDAVGNLTFINYPVSPDITLSYDALNRATNMVDALGSTRYSHNNVGRLLGEDGPWENDAVNYTYTNRLRGSLSLAQPVGPAWTQTYAYDSMKRLRDLASPAGAFEYDYGGIGSASPKTQVYYLWLPVAPNAYGAFFRYFEYDAVGRTTRAWACNWDWMADRHEYTYNVGGQRTSHIRRADNVVSGGSLWTNTVDYTYDASGQLKTATGKETDSSTRQMEQLGYFYDAAGNLNRRTNNALVQSFTVNNLNQLSNATRSGNLTVAGATTIAATSVTVNALAAERYADNTFARTNVTLVNGNNTFVAVATDSLGRGDTNTVTVSLPATVTFLYDLNGNLRTNGTRILEYDDENQLTKITEPNSWKAEFVYDGKMRMRVSRDYTWRNGAWVLTNETRRVYDGMLVLQERDQFNVPKLTYTRGLDLSGSWEGAGGIGGLLAMTEHQAQNLEHSYFHSDGNGNVTALVDTNQNVVARYLYDPFGNILSATGPKAALNKYRFSSKEWHATSGMVYYGYRWYIPELQRWPNRDPLAAQMPQDNRFWGNKLQIEVDQGPNLYWPFRNDPISHHDRDGRIVPILVCVIVAGVLTCGCSKAPPPPPPDPCPSQWPEFDKLIPKKWQCGALKAACDASCDTVDADCTVKCAQDCLKNFLACGRGLL